MTWKTLQLRDTVQLDDNSLLVYQFTRPLSKLAPMVQTHQHFRKHTGITELRFMACRVVWNAVVFSEKLGFVKRRCTLRATVPLTLHIYLIHCGCEEEVILHTLLSLCIKIYFMLPNVLDPLDLSREWLCQKEVATLMKFSTEEGKLRIFTVQTLEKFVWRHCDAEKGQCEE